MLQTLFNWTDIFLAGESGYCIFWGEAQDKVRFLAILPILDENEGISIGRVRVDGSILQVC